MRFDLIVSFLMVPSFAFHMVPATQAAVLPAGSEVEGKTLSEWSGEWWKWALSYPMSNNPLLDTTGALAPLGDMGSVFFLAGFFPPGSVTRTFAVPGGKYLFFPMISVPLIGQANPRARLADFIGNVKELHASVDGVPIPDLFSHREVSGEFAVTLPADDVIGRGPGMFTSSFADGYWLMLEPLAPGRHVINFGGSSQGNTDVLLRDFAVDITYAVPEPGSFLLLCAVALVGGLPVCRAFRKMRGRAIGRQRAAAHGIERRFCSHKLPGCSAVRTAQVISISYENQY